MLREQLVNNTEKILDENGFSYCESEGSFDIAAVRRTTLLLKVLLNVDSFQHEQSESLRIISKKIDASPLLIGIQTRYEKLSDGILYERFNVPTLTLKTFENIIINELPLLRRFRGGLYSRINAEKLRDARNRKNLSQSSLAEKTGVTKKSIYEHEAADRFALNEFVRKLEFVLNEDVSVPINPFEFDEPNPSRPRNSFEKEVSTYLEKMGFEANFIKKTVFNFVAREKALILLNADKDEKRIKKAVPHIQSFSKITKKPAMLVTKEEASYDLPAIQKDDLADMTSRELLRFLKRN